MTVSHPGAAHLQRYDLLLLVVDDLGVYSIRPQFLKLPIDRNIPVRCGLMGEYQGGTVSIGPRSNRIWKNRTFKTASCLATYFVCARAGQGIRAMLSGAVPDNLRVGCCSDSRVSWGWRTIEWVKAVCIIRTYPPLYVLGIFATRLAIISIAQCLASRDLLLLLLTFLPIFGPLRPLSVLILR